MGCKDVCQEDRASSDNFPLIIVVVSWKSKTHINANNMMIQFQCKFLSSLFWTNPLHCHDLFCQSGKKRQVVLASFGTLSLQQCWWNIKLIFCLFPSRPKSPCVHILWSWSRGEGGGHRVQHCQDLGQGPGAGSMTWSNEIFLVFLKDRKVCLKLETLIL